MTGGAGARQAGDKLGGDRLGMTGRGCGWQGCCLLAGGLMLPPTLVRVHAQILGSELGAKILMRLTCVEGQVPRLPNERPLMNQGGS